MHTVKQAVVTTSLCPGISAQLRTAPAVPGEWNEDLGLGWLDSIAYEHIYIYMYTYIFDVAGLTSMVRVSIVTSNMGVGRLRNLLRKCTRH
jgi:hypothetical protein